MIYTKTELCFAHLCLFIRSHLHPGSDNKNKCGLEMMMKEMNDIIKQTKPVLSCRPKVKVGMLSFFILLSFQQFRVYEGMANRGVDETPRLVPLPFLQVSKQLVLNGTHYTNTQNFGFLCRFR